MPQSNRLSCALKTIARCGRAGPLVEQLEPRQLMAADPITPDNPLWAVLPGSASVDGVLNEAAWAAAFTTTRYEPFRANSSAAFKMMYDASGMYFAFDVKDKDLWADGRGSGLGFLWEIETDDSVSIYFDPDNSRDEYFQSGDRLIGVNIANRENPQIGGGVTPSRRHKFDQGDGTGNALGVQGGGVLPTEIQYRNVVNGTINNSSDVDVGWVTEMFVPWSYLGLSGAPANGATAGMNFDIIFDNDGGGRNLTNNRFSSDPNVRFGTQVIDDVINGVQSSYHATLPGLRGPVNYAEVMFVDPGAGTIPAKITAPAQNPVTGVTGYSAKINFTAPAATTGGLGHVVGYEIRYASVAINSEGRWLGAAEFENAYVPRLRGLSESLRVIGLQPSVTYHFAIRARDAAGNLGPISDDFTFTTQSAATDVSGGDRVVPSPMGGTLVNERYESFMMVGDHIGLSWKHTRTLYPGEVWNPVNSQLVNYNTNKPTGEDGATYFAALKASGVNTMRLFIEQPTAYPAPTNILPNGTLWLESMQNGVSSYNANMRQLMLNVLQLAEANDIYMIFSPFETFFYQQAFQTGEFPWSADKGGPLTDLKYFFINQAGQLNTSTLQLAKNRMAQLFTWMNEPAFAPYVHRLIGWEITNEWDTFGLPVHPVGDAKTVPGFPIDTNSGREDEYRLRAQWVGQLGQYIRDNDPKRLVINSMIGQDPRGPQGRFAFNSRVFDVNMPHFYSVSVSEPVNSPDASEEIRPAADTAGYTNYWLGNTSNGRPLLNGEFGNSRENWPNQTPAYGAGGGKYTEAVDEDIFRTVIWSGLAAGQAGTGLKIPTEERVALPMGMILSDNMRGMQKTVSNFLFGTGLALDLTNFNRRPLSGQMTVTSTAGKKLLAYGSTDGVQGIVYLLQNLNQTTGNVTDAILTITGLRPDQLVDAEVWATTPGASAPLATISGKFVATGTLTLNIPAFSRDVAIKFKARAGVGQSQKIVSTSTNTDIVAFFLGVDGQPQAQITNIATGASTVQDVSTIAKFTGRVLDMTAFTTNGDTAWVALTDENHHLWIISGNPVAGTWGGGDLTALIGAPGLTSDLTTYQPSWGSIHIAGLDARGNAINYWWSPGLPTWEYTDLTTQFSGPTMTGGLTGFVTGWDALNLAGLDANGDVIVYWWVPGFAAWQNLNMTTTVNGPKFVGQLDAFVISQWGGLNITGLTSAGEVYAFWWSPGQPSWQSANLSDAGNGPVVALGTESVVSQEGGINVFALDSSNNLQFLRWSPANPNDFWRSSNATSVASGPTLEFPVGSGSGGSRVLVFGRSNSSAHTLVVYQYLLNTGLWTAVDTLIPIEL